MFMLIGSLLAYLCFSPLMGEIWYTRIRQYVWYIIHLVGFEYPTFCDFSLFVLLDLSNFREVVQNKTNLSILVFNWIWRKDVFDFCFPNRLLLWIVSFLLCLFFHLCVAQLCTFYLLSLRTCDSDDGSHLTCVCSEADYHFF